MEGRYGVAKWEGAVTARRRKKQTGRDENGGEVADFSHYQAPQAGTEPSGNRAERWTSPLGRSSQHAPARFRQVVSIISRYKQVSAQLRAA